MKKIIILISLILSVTMICQIALIGKTSKSFSDKFMLVDKENTNLLKVDTSKKYQGNLVFCDETRDTTIKYRSSINKIETYTKQVKDPSLFSACQIIEKGESITLSDDSTFVLENNSRVYKISDKTVTFENMDNVTTTVKIAYDDLAAPFEDSVFTCRVKKETQMEIIDYSLNESKGIYTLNLRLINNLYAFSSQGIVVYMNAPVYINGTYIYSGYLQKDDDGYFVYKLYVFKDASYYKRVDVEYLYSVGSYSVIKSDQLQKNNIVFVYEEDN